MLVEQNYQIRGTAIGVPTKSLAAKRFCGYNPEADQPARVLQPTTLSNLEKLRRLRSDLYRMPPEAVLGMMELHRNLDMLQALELAKRTGALMVPNLIHDSVLIVTGANYSTWTGTMVIYEAPDEPFGKEVRFEAIRFTVPERFRGKKNCVLIVEYPDFDLVVDEIGYKLVVPDQSNLHLIKNFPKNLGWSRHRISHKFFGIPAEMGGSVSYSKLRHLTRLPSQCITCIARGFDQFKFFYDSRNVDLADNPSIPFGVALIP